MNLAAKHPAYCTCQDCTDKFLKKRKIKPGRRATATQEKVEPHPASCDCATCRLLSSVGDLPGLDRVRRSPQHKSGLLGRLLGKFRP